MFIEMFGMLPIGAFILGVAILISLNWKEQSNERLIKEEIIKKLKEKNKRSDGNG